MTRSTPRVLVATVACGLLWNCSGSGAPEDTAVPEPLAADEPVTAEDDPLPAIEPLRRQAVIIYYPSATGSGLIGEMHEIYLTATPGDRAKQILADLIEGPNDAEALPILSHEVRLRQVYVLPNGTAWVDFSPELVKLIQGGSTREIFTVYSIVDSLALNISEIQRVGILIDGETIETLSGHLDLRWPLPPDRSLILGTLDLV